MRKFLFVMVMMLVAAISFAASQKESKNTEVVSVLEVDLDTIYSDFLKNGVTADLKYNGQVITVQFEVSSLEVSGNSRYRYMMKGPNYSSFYDSTYLYFYCYTDNSEIEKISNVEIGDTLTVQGECTVEVLGIWTYIKLYGAKIL